MKGISIVLLFLLGTHLTLFAQLPQAINFQGVAVKDGEILPNTKVGLKLSIIDSAQSGKTVYREFHGKTTNEFGSFQLQVGKADYRIGGARFRDIDWQTGKKYLNISFSLESDQSDSIDLGTLEMLTVPFAFAAESVTNIHDQNAKKGDLLTFDGNYWVPGFESPSITSTQIDYSIESSDEYILVDASGNDIDLILPKASEAQRQVTIKLEKSGNDIYVLTQNGETIDLGNSQNNDSISIMADGDFVTLLPKGNEWICLERHLQIFAYAGQAKYHTISNQVGTAIDFDIERQDTYNSFSNSTGTFIVPPGGSGFYTFHGIFYCLPDQSNWDAGDKFRIYYSYKGGNTTIASGAIQLDHAQALMETTTGSFSILLNEGDKVQLFASQESGGDASILSSKIWITKED